jgi:hypothetical protein
MIKVKVKNRHNFYYERSGYVSEVDWNSSAIWLTLSISGKEVTIARSSLEAEVTDEAHRYYHKHRSVRQT